MSPPPFLFRYAFCHLSSRVTSIIVPHWVRGQIATAGMQTATQEVMSSKTPFFFYSCHAMVPEADVLTLTPCVPDNT